MRTLSKSFTRLALGGAALALVACLNPMESAPSPDNEASSLRTGGETATVAKASICHIPPGNPANAHTLTIPLPTLRAHLAHGDQLGACKFP